jgi:hypothetical protein
VRENEVEHRQAPLHIFDFVFATVAEILAAEVPIQLSGEQVIHDAMLRKAFGPGMFVGLKFCPEERRTLSPMRPGKAQKMTRHEVAGVRSDEIEKMRLFRCIAERLKRFDMRGGDRHSVRILAVSSCSSRMRRRREASSRLL